MCIVCACCQVRGALLGSLIVYCLPTFIFLKSERGKASGRASKLVHSAIFGYGALMSLVGTAVVLLAP